MTKKRFLSIILTVLLVLSIIPTTPAKAASIVKYGAGYVSGGIGSKTAKVYTNPEDTTPQGILQYHEGFTVTGLFTTSRGATLVPIEYNTPSGVKTGYVNKVVVHLYENTTTATVKWNVSVYFGTGSDYQRCGTLYAGERIAVLERGKTHSYVEYNDEVHGKRKRAYVVNEAITLRNEAMPIMNILPVDNWQEHKKCYLGDKFTVYSGPSTEYEPVGSASNIHVYWIDRTKEKEGIDSLFYDVSYVKYQVTGTNTWKNGYILFDYRDIVFCEPNCKH